MPRAKILKAKVSFISLCPRGANRLPVMYKEEDGLVYFNPIVKDDIEKGEITAVVYAPDVLDSQGEYADAEVIKDMAYEFAKSGQGIDIRHNNKALPKDEAHVAETFLIQKGDARFKDMRDYDGNPVDVTGGWGVVLKINGEELRKEYREGKWQGVSMGGVALRQAEKSGQGDFDMDKKELEAALEASATATVKGVVDGMTAVFKTAGLIQEKPDAPADTKPKHKHPKPMYKADKMSDPKEQRKYLKALKIWQLNEDNDPATVEGFEAITKGMEEINEEFKDEETPLTDIEKNAGCEETDSAELRRAKVLLAKHEGKSNIPMNKDGSGGTGSANAMGATDKDEIESINFAKEQTRKRHGTSPASAKA